MKFLLILCLAWLPARSATLLTNQSGLVTISGNSTTVSITAVETTKSFLIFSSTVDDNDDNNNNNNNNNGTCTIPWYRHFLPSPNITVIEGKKRLREEKRRARAKERARKAAAKVVVDYRPVMSRIIDD